MSESMRGLKRTHRCGEVVGAELGSEVTVMGWVQRSRNKGGVVFTDLRDRSGLLQLIFEEEDCGEEVFRKAQSLKSEYCIAVEGRLERRSDPNPKLPTGELEVRAKTLRILSESETPPFPIEENTKTREELRLKYRFLDLRRPDLQARIMLRSKIAAEIRRFMTGEGFLEIETPTLIKSTPEGARDYLVPSRVHPGSMYALPQSPQLLKQLLMCSGYDRYFQLARCYRDEDLRADRQPEFTQVDMELSFVNADDVLAVNEKLLHSLFKEVLGVEVRLPIQRMTWREAMERYGSDKPDLRFGMELTDVSAVVKDCEFAVFAGALSAGGSVRGIRVDGQGNMPRKKIDALVEFAKGYGAKGLAYVAIQEDGSLKSSFAKFMKEEEMQALVSAMGGKNSDLLLFAADKNKTVFDVLGALRVELARQLELLDKNEFRFVWITEFPLLEWSEEEARFKAMHHPFTMPMEEDWDKIDSDPGAVRAEAYDIVLNGNEIGGGSVRIHRSDVQEKMFEVLGLTREVAEERFGFLLDAFRYGVPPHAGLAYGLDRLAMLMAGADTIRDVIAFPKVKDASDLMMNQVLEAENGAEALAVFEREPDIALVLLDVMMPELDGFETLKELRRISEVPVLMLTARSEERDELRGFSLGADEYIAKPFSPKVLMARVEAVLKRTAANPEGVVIEIAGIRLDERAHEVSVDGKSIDLSFKEFELLRYFLENKGIALSREKILNHVWNYDYFGDARTIDTHVKKLRAKMGEKGAYIRTIWGMGYKFEPEEA